MDCYSDAALAYYYSICQCAYSKYDYVESYIRKMIRNGIIWGINSSDEVKALCKKHNLKRINLDDDTFRKM